MVGKRKRKGNGSEGPTEPAVPGNPDELGELREKLAGLEGQGALRGQLRQRCASLKKRKVWTIKDLASFVGDVFKLAGF